MRTLQRIRARNSKIGYARVGSLLMLGALVWVLWSAARDVSNWKWLNEDAKAAAQKKQLTVGEELRLAALEVAQTEAPKAPTAPSNEPAQPPAEAPASEPAPAAEPNQPDEDKSKTESANTAEPPSPAQAPQAEEPTKPAAPPTDTPAPAAETAQPAPSAKVGESEHKPAFSEGAGQQESAPKNANEPTGPTDLDVEEQDAVVEEFQALSDGSLDLGKEEMHAYWRLFRWVKSQTAEQMLARATTKVTLHDMMRRPSKVRGKLIKLNLTVAMIRSFDVEDPNSAGVKKVYELWGWSDDTKAWLYCGLTPELPAKMPLGANLHERVTFVGYFMKVQGYHAANSRPNERPLSSPLLVGRVIWHPRPPAPPPSPTEAYWIWGSIAVAGLLFIGGCLYPFLRRPPVRALPPKRTDLNDWGYKPDFDSEYPKHNPRDLQSHHVPFNPN